MHNAGEGNSLTRDRGIVSSDRIVDALRKDNGKARFQVPVDVAAMK